MMGVFSLFMSWNFRFLLALGLIIANIVLTIILAIYHNKRSHKNCLRIKRLEKSIQEELLPYFQKVAEQRDKYKEIALKKTN